MPNKLTPQELTCVQLAGERLTDKEIAQRLGISPKTVKNNLSRSYQKLGVPGRREAARALGLLDPGPSSPIFSDTPLVTTPPATGSVSASGSRSWPLPAPPVGRVRVLLILGFLIVAAISTMAVVLTVWTAIDAASRRAPPNAIQALSEDRL